MCGCAPTVRWPADSLATPVGAKDFTLRWDARDLNGAPLNPYWAPQLRDRSRLPPLGEPCASAAPDAPACTDQSPSRDLPTGVHRDVCESTHGVLPGHVNWTVATYTGRVRWLHLADDGDVNLLFEPDDPTRGSTKGNLTVGGDPTRPGIALEFAAYEMLFRFDTDWWRQLRARVEEWATTAIDTSRIDALLNPRHPDRPPRAVVLGLFGLDCEHECRSELHPVYALAIEVEDAPSDNTWAMFVRNWGNEGSCSHADHLLHTPQDLVRLALPALRNGAPRMVTDETQYASTYSGTPPPTIAYAKETGVVVTFALPEPGASALSELVLHLRWDQEAGAAPPDGADAGQGRVAARATSPSVGLVVSRVAAIDRANVRIALPATFSVGAFDPRAMQPGPFTAPQTGRIDAREIVAAKKRADDARLHLLCAELRPLSADMPDKWRKACGQVR